MSWIQTTLNPAVYNRAQEAASSALLDEHDELDGPQPLNLVDQFIALLLATFIESGLLEVRVTGDLVLTTGINRLDRREYQRSEPESYATLGGDTAESQPDLATTICGTNTGRSLPASCAP